MQELTIGACLHIKIYYILLEINSGVYKMNRHNNNYKKTTMNVSNMNKSLNKSIMEDLIESLL